MSTSSIQSPKLSDTIKFFITKAKSGQNSSHSGGTGRSKSQESVHKDLAFFGNFLNMCVFKDMTSSIDTCCVYVTKKHMNFGYNTDFLAGLTQHEVNFVAQHEAMHLIFNHPERTAKGGFSHRLSNMAQDMIINHMILSTIDPNQIYTKNIKSDTGKNYGLFIPKEYKGNHVFEELYRWLNEKFDEWKEKQKKKGESEGEGGEGDGQGQGNGQGNGQPGGKGGKNKGQGQGSSGKEPYGPYGQSPTDENGTIDTHSLDSIFQDIENGTATYLDSPVEDEVSPDHRKNIVDSSLEICRTRGLASGDMETVINQLRKRKKDYLSYIKRNVSHFIFGRKKGKTISKPNRRGVEGAKGTRKYKVRINVLLDTSGSMGNTFDRVLSYINQSGIECNFMQCDTQIQVVEKITTQNQLSKIRVKGLGGTVLQPGLDYVTEHFNKYNTVILTDGYTDSLDLSNIRGRVLIISIGVECPITADNNKLIQIVVDENEYE
jgi:predicted metal-dependent peptidase